MSARLHRLGAGVRVICDPMPGLKTLAVSVVAEGGARHEDAARSGWSHLLEHLVFKGAGDMSAREIVDRIESAGGSINAATGYERTSYQVRALEDGLPLALQVVSDLLFRPRLDPAEIEREKAVVGQEIAEAFDTPDDHVFEMAQANAFQGQPLGRPILGTVESIAAADRAALEVWRARLYAPERLTVSVAGAVDETELLALAERWFDQPVSGVAAELEPARFTGGAASLARRIEQANLVLELPAFGARDPDQPALALFTEILGGGMASRLFQQAREARGLAYAVDAWLETYGDAGVQGVFAGCAPEQAAELARVAAGEIAAMADRVTPEETDRARAQARSALFMALESPAARAERNAWQAQVFGRLIPVEETSARLAAVAPEDVRRVAGRLLAARASAGAVLGPRRAADAPEAFHRALFG